MRPLLRRLWYALRQRQLDDELADEIAFHRAMTQQELEARGVDRPEAARAAQRALGNDLAARARARDAWVAPWIQDVMQDVRFAGRLLTRDRAFGVTAVLVLGLGIGVNNVFFAVAYAHTLRGLPIERADRVLAISALDDRSTDRAVPLSTFDELRRSIGGRIGIAAFQNAPLIVGDEGRAPDRVDGAYVSAHAFGLLGVEPVHGRSFSADEDRPGAALVVMLGNALWQSRYGGDRAILGRSVLVNGRPASVIGIVPDESGFPSAATAWLPLSHIPASTVPMATAPTVQVLARVADEINLVDTRSEIESIVERIWHESPQTGKGLRARVVPINQRYFARLEGPWLAFLSASILIVAISAANVANLMLARTAQRSREIAVRTSLGASRHRVVRQLLIEGSVVAALAGSAGLGIAFAGLRLFKAATPPMPYWFDYHLDGRTIVALASVSLLTLLVFALAPALHASKADVNLVLKDSGKTSIGRRSTHRWTTTFLVAELALTVVLLANLALGARASGPDLPSDTVIETRDILTASITLPSSGYPTSVERTDLYSRLEERLRALPGVSAAAVASALPRRGAAERLLDLAGRPRVDDESAPRVGTIAVGPGYFDALGVGIARGRAFSERDGTPGQPHAIVNERFVEMFLGSEDPIGRRLALRLPGSPEASPEWISIVGVAPDIRQRAMQRVIDGVPRDPLVYLPLRTSSPATAALIVRMTRAPSVTAATLREELMALDPGLPLYRAATMAAVIGDAEFGPRMSVRLVYFLTFIALTLSTVGLYAVAAYSVAQRTQEIGLRMALGAQANQVRRLVLHRALVQIAIGLAVGYVAALAWDRVFPSGRPATGVSDPQSIVLVGAVLLVVMLLACIVPVRRAMRVDPVVALRHE